MKLFVTDLDGTLVEYNNITDENLEGIKKLNDSGELLAVATGRAYNSCTFLKEKYESRLFNSLKWWINNRQGW